MIGERGEGEKEKKRGRVCDFWMPSARASHLSSPYPSFIDSVIFRLWVIYGLVSCLCTLSHLTVTCVPLRRLQINAAKQIPTAVPTDRLSFKSSTSEADFLFLSRNNSGQWEIKKPWTLNVSYQQGAACGVPVPRSIWDVQRLKTVCSEQLLSKYEDVIDTRSNIGHSDETSLFALFFPLCIYSFIQCSLGFCIFISNFK